MLLASVLQRQLVVAFGLFSFVVNGFSVSRHDPVRISIGRLNSQRNQMEFTDEDDLIEPMYSTSYDPLKFPNQEMENRDLEDMLMQRSLRFYDDKHVAVKETCYLVGLDDKSKSDNSGTSFTMEESLTELSELAGAAGLTVAGTTYQRVARPSIEYYIGSGKVKDILRSMESLKCCCVIFDTELSPSQQKNLELSFNQDKKKRREGTIKVIDRTALILDIFARHARTREGKLQVRLALMTYRLPRLTNMWSHLERQSAGARGKSIGGVGLRGPGEKQLESDRRQMKSKISAMKRSIDSVRRHRSMHRRKRKQLGVPVVALVGYTNAGKSCLLNTMAPTSNTIFSADMLFATLDPTTRMASVPNAKHPDILVTDTVGFIQNLPTNLVAAFRATLEEISEADVLLHVADINNDAWKKQEAAVLRELARMGLGDKPVVTAWNKMDLQPKLKEYWKLEASKREQTVAVSALTEEGVPELMRALEDALSSSMTHVSVLLPHSEHGVLSAVHSFGVVEKAEHREDGVWVEARVPLFLENQLRNPPWLAEEEEANLEVICEVTGEILRDADFVDVNAFSGGARATQVGKEENMESEDFDWKSLAKGRHSFVHGKRTTA
jgi:GTP-binding protein HflX